MAPTDTTCNEPGNESYLGRDVLVWEVAEPDNAALRTGIFNADIVVESRTNKAVLFERVPCLLRP